MSVELNLRLMDQTPSSTVSSLKHGDKFICFIIEDGYHEVKIPGETRIPGGKYLLKKKVDGRFFTKYSKEYGHKFVVEISGIDNFEAVLFHIGNRPKDTRGCNLTNDSVTFDKKVNEFVGVNSEVCYRKFYDYMSTLMDTDDVYLNVSR